MAKQQKELAKRLAKQREIERKAAAEIDDLNVKLLEKQKELEAANEQQKQREREQKQREIEQKEKNLEMAKRQKELAKRLAKQQKEIERLAINNALLIVEKEDLRLADLEKQREIERLRLENDLLRGESDDLRLEIERLADLLVKQKEELEAAAENKQKEKADLLVKQKEEIERLADLLVKQKEEEANQQRAIERLRLEKEKVDNEQRELAKQKEAADLEIERLRLAKQRDDLKENEAAEIERLRLEKEKVDNEQRELEENEKNERLRLEKEKVDNEQRERELEKEKEKEKEQRERELEKEKEQRENERLRLENEQRERELEKEKEQRERELDVKRTKREERLRRIEYRGIVFGGVGTLYQNTNLYQIEHIVEKERSAIRVYGEKQRHADIVQNIVGTLESAIKKTEKYFKGNKWEALWKDHKLKGNFSESNVKKILNNQEFIKSVIHFAINNGGVGDQYKDSKYNTQAHNHIARRLSLHYQEIAKTNGLFTGRGKDDNLRKDVEVGARLKRIPILLVDKIVDGAFKGSGYQSSSYSI